MSRDNRNSDYKFCNNYRVGRSIKDLHKNERGKESLIIKEGRINTCSTRCKFRCFQKSYRNGKKPFRAKQQKARDRSGKI